MNCIASVLFPRVRSDQDTDAAMEGTCAAWVSEVVINGDASSTEDMLGEAHGNGWEVDADMVRHIESYIQIVSQVKGKAEVYMRHPTLPIGGTADHIGWSEDMMMLYITDLKYGYRVVSPNSWQLVAYLMLLLANVPQDKWPQFVTLAIYQPRATHKDGPYRKVVLSIDEALKRVGQMEDRIHEILRTTPGSPLATPGGHCAHCPAAFGCEALTHSVYSIWEALQSRVYHTPTPEQLSEELIMIDKMDEMFTARKTAVKTEAEMRIKEGGFVPGWHIEKRWGKRKFTVDPSMVHMMTGVDPASGKPCTPAELLRRGANKDVVDTITTTPMIGAKLARFDSDDIAAQFAASKPRKA